MISEIEKRREEILRQLNSQARRLEHLSPDAAKRFNAQLSKLVEKLAEQLAQAERGKGSGR